MKARHAARLPLRIVALALIAAMAAGCAAPPLPPGVDLRRAGIVAGQAEPVLEINGLPGGKAAGAGVGFATGAGLGIAAGALPCLATFVFAPACFIAVTAVGAVAGGSVGAVRTESVEAMALKTAVVKAEFIAQARQDLLANALQARLHDAYALEVPVLAADRATTPDARRPLLVDVAIVEVGTEGKREFALRLVARLTLHRAGETAALYAIAKEVQSETELTLEQWVDNDRRALRGVLDRCVRQAAQNLAGDMMQPTAAEQRASRRPSGVTRYSTSCEDSERDWAVASTGSALVPGASGSVLNVPPNLAVPAAAASAPLVAPAPL